VDDDDEATTGDGVDFAIGNDGRWCCGLLGGTDCRRDGDGAVAKVADPSTGLGGSDGCRRGVDASVDDFSNSRNFASIRAIFASVRSDRPVDALFSRLSVVGFPASFMILLGRAPNCPP